MEQNYPNFPQNVPGQNWNYPPARPAGPVSPFFPTGKRETSFGLLILIFGMLLCNSVLYGGFSLGFAVFSVICTLCSTIYLLSAGNRLRPYPAAILTLCMVITAAFARSDDGFVKFVMLCFLAMGVNLGLCLLAGQNHWAPGGIASLLDGPRTAFLFGVGRLGYSARGLRMSGKTGGKTGKRGGAIFLGLVLALLLLCVMIPLLTRADAAFEALIKMLPQLDMAQIIATLIFGSILVCYLYTRGVALRHNPKTAPAVSVGKGGLNVLTVNTVLIAVSVVYLAYLLSQLAYLFGGFAGIVPEGFTRAEYARRGFFEMAAICAINLGIIALAMGLIKEADRKLLSIRLLCLFIGLVTLFLVTTASAKMFLYIGGFGLSRLRVLTEVVTVFLGIATLFVMIWLFVPKLPYMKAILLTALLIGATVIWADVDTVVARYNVTAYQTHRLESIDVSYLEELGSGAVPYLVELTRDADEAVAAEAKEILQNWAAYGSDSGDIRGWNYVNQVAADLLKEFS